MFWIDVMVFLANVHGEQEVLEGEQIILYQEKPPSKQSFCSRTLLISLQVLHVLSNPWKSYQMDEH